MNEKHLEFIQNVITRMNSNSFLIKGWALTIFSVIMAFASKDTNSTMILVNFVPIFVFWGLDAFYLRKERLFRELYKATIKKNSEVPVFSMNTECYEKTWKAGLKCVVQSRFGRCMEHCLFQILLH